MKRLFAAALFVLTLVGTAAVFARVSAASWHDVLVLPFARLRATEWMAVGALTAVFYALDWVRFRSVLAVLGHALPLPAGLQLTAVSYFVTSLSPAAELHTPAMVYLLARRGVPVSEALAASVTKSLVMTLWICAVATAALGLNRSIALPESLRLALPALLLPVGVLAALVGGIAAWPDAVQRGTQRLADLLGRRDKTAWLVRALQGIARTAHAAAAVVRPGSRRHLVCHAASLAFLATYIAIGAVLARSLGIDLTLPRAVTVFATSLMVAYLAPVPGGIGITELATCRLLDPGMGAAAMAVSVLLRVLCWYLAAVPGGFVLMDVFRRDGRGWSLPALPR